MLPQVPAVLGENVTDFGQGSVLVIRRHFQQHRHTTRPVTFVDHFLVRGAGKFTRPLLNGALDVIRRHVLSLGGHDGRTQARIGIRVSTTYPRGDGDFLDDLCKGLSTLRV